MSDDIRALAESWKDGGNPVIDELARFALAVLDALDEAKRRAQVALDHGDYHYSGAVEAVVRDIASNLEAHRG